MLINRVKDRVLRTIIVVASLITISTLVTIVSYTLYRGFNSRTVSKWDVLPCVEHSVTLDGREYFIIVNRKLKVEEIPIDTLLSIMKGRVRSWGLITGQDYKIKLYTLYDNDLEIKSKVTREMSSQEVIRAISLSRGAIGILPIDKISSLSGTKILGIKRVVFAVNSSVLKTVNNKRLRALKSEAVFDLLKGKYGSWSMYGGRDLDLRIIIPPESNSIFNALNSRFNEVLYTSINSIHPSSNRELIRILKETEGAVAPVDYRVAKKHGLDILPITQIDKGRNLTLDYLIREPKKSGRVGGVSTIILNTVIMILLTLLITVPIGVGAAIYLTMYSKKGRLNNLIRTGIETLAGIPSIIFGLFGFILFVEAMGLGAGLLSGTLTISLMILPTIIRTSEEAIKTVPVSLYAGSLALGATKWQSIGRVIVPAASPGIISGLILAMGRAVGETAALLFTMGSDYRLVTDLTSPARVLSVHLYLLVKEGISFEKGFATATILIVVILVMNLVTTFCINRIGGVRSSR